MAQTRRAHRKSRSGCTECKRRRIKVGSPRNLALSSSSLIEIQCDEESPCRQCVRHGKACVYLPANAAQPTTAAQPITVTQPISSQSICSPTASASSPNTLENVSQSTISPPPFETSNTTLPNSVFDLRDMALLHHWSLTTSVSIISTPSLDHYWQTLIPQVAFRHSYVMHSILSLTALHIAYLNPLQRRSSLAEAAQHHFKSLDGFREDIAHMGPDNCDALFVNSTLTFFYAFLTFGKLHDDDSSTSGAARTSRVLGTTWIPLVRGVLVVLHPIYEHVRTGPLKSVLSLGNWDELDSNPSSDAYDDRILKIREIWGQGEHAGVYNETLNLLLRCRTWIAQFKDLQIDDDPAWGYNRGWSGPFMWLTLTPQKYFELLEQRQPPALVIFAWFGASLYALNQHWWMEGCGKSIVDVADECLGPYWAPWTEGARQMVRPS
jgi:hypothetical protein